MDEDLRESYRQRLNEIFESGRTGGDSQEPLLEPVTTVVPAAPRVELELPVLVRTQDPVPPTPPRQVDTPTMADASDLAEEVEESTAGASEALGEAAEKVARSLTQGLAAIMSGQERQRSADAARLDAVVTDTQKAREEVGELRESVQAQQRLIEGQVSATISRINERLETLLNTLQAQAEVIAGLRAGNDGLLRNQEAVQQRLDNQADVIRELTSAAEAQQNRWSQYRSAVDKLKEITDVSTLPVRLPDNL
jgi:uncharacterized phage infection (PIP) family protein YhgE